MAEIRKKVWPEYFEKIVSGKKKFELRLGDFECKEGDVLVLEEYNLKTKSYTGRKIKKKVSFVLKTKELKFWTKEEIDKYGFIVVSLEDVHS